MFRINHALYELKNGRNITDTAFETGYESLSGFGYTFKKIMGKSPEKGMNRNIIVLSRLSTPLGPMYAGATDEGICMLEFVDRRMLETEFGDLQKLLNAEILWAENQHIIQVRKELQEYFSGTRKKFDVSLVFIGSDFQKQAWKSLTEIPYGKTVSYQQQALNIGKPNCVRAVANANGMNRIAIIIPCHRVIGSNGKLTGYGGGIERKRWLISHEMTHSQQENSLFSSLFATS
jgi:AraC family transcriptional regulator of adaptative response/methylated-DNA-[protein]-cysteine methyltransferase